MPMGRPKQPIDLKLYKGKKHLTKEEIAEARKTEVKAPADKVKAPTGTEKEVKKRFNKYAKQLVEIGIMTNLDVHILVRYCQAEMMYDEEYEKLRSMSSTVELPYTDEVTGEVKERVLVNGTYKELNKIVKSHAAECKALASELGLSISSRCKLVVPKKETPADQKDPRESKFNV